MLLVYKTLIISTIVDCITRIYPEVVYKTLIISTIVDIFEFFRLSRCL